ncbi:MAG: hypothetical protein NTZ72_12900 [Afipia sp.]|nr:hypothetical protein [Afipia sp.]
MGITEGANAVYFLSPLSVVLVILLAVFIGGGFVSWIKRKDIIAQGGKLRLAVAFICSFLMIATAGWLIIDRLSAPRPQLVIHPDYVACVSWTDDKRNYMRIPWHYISNVSRRYAPYFDINIQFDLVRNYLHDAPWTDHVRSNGWVNCRYGRNISQNRNGVAG